MPLFEKTEEERSYSESNDPAAGEKAASSAPAVNTAQQSALDDLLGLGDIGTGAPVATSAPAPVMNSSNLVRCGHDNNKPPPIAKRTPESERGPFSDPETTLRTIRQGTFKITFSTINIGETRQNPKKKWSILIHQGRAE